MKGLIIKDLLLMKKQLKIMLSVVAIYIMWGVCTDNVTMTVYMIALFSVFMLINCYTYDDTSKWNTYALTMPVSCKDLVLGRYIEALILTAVGILTSSFSIVFIDLITGKNIEKSQIIYIGQVWSGAIIFFSIAAPLYVKLGMEKCRLLLIAIMVLPLFVILAIVRFHALAYIFRFVEKLNFIIPSKSTLDILAKLLPYEILGITALVFILSYFISVNIMEKKEF